MLVMRSRKERRYDEEGEEIEKNQVKYFSIAISKSLDLLIIYLLICSRKYVSNEEMEIEMIR